MTYFANMYARSSADKLSKYGIKYAYFVSLSMMIKIESYLTFVIGSFDRDSFIIKSITTFFQAPFNACGDYIFPYSLCLNVLFLLQTSHLRIRSSTYFLIPGK